MEPAVVPQRRSLVNVLLPIFLRDDVDTLDVAKKPAVLARL